MVYPKPGYIKELWIPEELKEDPYFFGPSEVGDLARVDDAEVTQVREISLASWGKSYTWLD